DQKEDKMATVDPKRSTRGKKIGAGMWSLQDAKAQFSELVRMARARGPQRVTVHGRDAVVVIDAADYDRQHQPASGRLLVEILAASPLRDVEFGRVADRPKVRTVTL